MKTPVIGFIGLGKLGLECAEVFAGHYTTYGYDIAPVKSDTVKVVKTLKTLVKKSDWIFIAAPTPHDKDYGGEIPTTHLESKDFDYTVVKDIINKVIKGAAEYQCCLANVNQLS